MRHRNHLAALVCVLALLLAAVPAGAARRKEIVLRLYEIGCTAPAVLDPLPTAWLAHRALIRDCPVLTMERRQVLSVRMVRLPKGATPAAPLPLPLLLDVQGRVVGQLPGIWPGREPDLNFVYFTRWRDDFPQRIEMKTLEAEADRWTVRKTDYAPLVWNPARQRYEAGK